MRSEGGRALCTTLPILSKPFVYLVFNPLSPFPILAVKIPEPNHTFRSKIAILGPDPSAMPYLRTTASLSSMWAA